MAEQQVISQINSYRIEGEIGRSAFGTTYKGIAPDGQAVAIKVLTSNLSALEAYTRRLDRQVSVAQRLDAPRMVKPITTERGPDGEVIVVSQFAEGECLEARLTAMGVPVPNSGIAYPGRVIALPVARVARVIRQVAVALDTANKAGLAHYNLTPRKILVNPDGVVHVLGFGMARDTAALREFVSTDSRGLFDTAYTAPELARGDALCDVRADLYSLGVIAYLMLAGQAPFSGPKPADFFRQHQEVAPPPLRKLNKAVPRNLAMVIDRLLAKEPIVRHASPEALVEDLDRVERGEDPAVVYERERSTTQKALVYGGIGVAVVVLLLSLVFSFRWWQQEQKVVLARDFLLKREYVAALNALDAPGVPNSAKVLDLRRRATDGLNFENAVRKGNDLVDQHEYEAADAAYREALTVPTFANSSMVLDKLASLAPARRKYQFDSLLEQATGLRNDGQLEVAAELVHRAMQVQGFEDSAEARDALESIRTARNEVEFLEIMGEARRLFAQRLWDDAEVAVQRAIKVPGFSADTGAERMLRDIRIGRIRVLCDLAMDASLWDDVMVHTAAILAIDPNDFQALEDRASAEREIQPSLTIRTRLGNDFVEGATVYLDGVRQPGLTPMVLRLARGQTHSMVVTFVQPKETKENKRTLYMPSELTYTVAQGGTQNLTVDIQAREMPEDLADDPNGSDFAPLEGLAPGSAEAQERQRQAVARYAYPLEVQSHKLGIPFRLIPPGTFTMGSAADAPFHDADESPQVAITITKPFYMAKYEVTQEQWARVMGGKPWQFTHAGKTTPVESVSYDMIQGFLDKLCNIEQVPTGTYRLPTEAEWEYACRAGTDATTYVGEVRVLGRNNNPELDAIAWYSGNSGVEYPGGWNSDNWGEQQYYAQKSGPHPVGLKKPNAYGLYDMIGNVWEWCEDYYWYALPTKAKKDYIGPPGGQLKVVRGGGWNRNLEFCRTANRYALRQDVETNVTTGFRIVRVLVAGSEGEDDDDDATDANAEAAPADPNAVPTTDNLPTASSVPKGHPDPDAPTAPTTMGETNIKNATEAVNRADDKLRDKADDAASQAQGAIDAAANFLKGATDKLRGNDD